MRAFPRLVLMLTVLPAKLPAAESATVTERVPVMDGGMLLQTMMGLLLVLGVIFVLGWLLRRIGRIPGAGKGDIRILGGVALGTRERAVLLQVENTRLLVGVAPGRIQTLHVLAEGGAQSTGTEAMSFHEALDSQPPGDGETS